MNKFLRVFLLFCFLISSSYGLENGANSNIEELNLAIDETLNESQFQWKLPNEKWRMGINDFEPPSWLKKFAEWSFEKFVDFLEWIYKTKNKNPHDFDKLDLNELASQLIYILLGIVLLFLIYKLIRHLIQKKNSDFKTADISEPISIDDEHISADARPYSDWFSLAQEKINEGNYRLALRAFLLGQLAILAQDKRIFLARYKSNREYGYELRSRSRDNPSLYDIFAENSRIYEQVWYGDQPAELPMIERVKENLKSLGYKIQ
jgi:hypothetical protein